MCALTEDWGIPCSQCVLGVDVSITVGNLRDDDVLQAVLDCELSLGVILRDNQTLLEFLDERDSIIRHVLIVEEVSHCGVTVSRLPDDGCVDCLNKVIGFCHRVRVEDGVTILIEGLRSGVELFVAAVDFLKCLTLSSSQSRLTIFTRLSNVSDLTERQVFILYIRQIPSLEQLNLHITHSFTSAEVTLPDLAIFG